MTDYYDPKRMFDSIFFLIVSVAMVSLLWADGWWKIIGLFGLINVPITCYTIYRRYKRGQELDKARQVRDEWVNQ